LVESVSSLINSIENIKEGESFTGKYQIKRDRVFLLLDKYGLQTQQIINVVVLLMWSSYFIGMIMPGQQALYSQFELSINKNLTTQIDQIEYNVNVEKVDTRFNLIQMTFELLNNIKIADGEFSAFVRPILNQNIFTRNVIFNQYKKILSGKTALITGASRGLGAILVNVLAGMSCRVIVNYQYSQAEAVHLQEEINKRGNGEIELWQGDISNPSLVKTKYEEIMKQNRNIDILVCNAFQSPHILPFELTTISRMSKYIINNIEMTSVPLAIFTPMLNNVNGHIIIISSEYVVSPVKEFPQYISAKSAIEGLVFSIAMGYRKINWFIVRPPKMLTDMSNSPVGNCGLADPALVAKDICEQIFITKKTTDGINIIKPLGADKTGRDHADSGK
jgi:short-subunit dehydrogenase